MRAVRGALFTWKPDETISTRELVENLYGNSDLIASVLNKPTGRKVRIETPQEGENRSCCGDWPEARSEGEQLSKTGSHTARCFSIGKKERDQFKLNQYKWLRGLHQIRSRLFPYTPGTGNRYRFQRLENGLGIRGQNGLSNGSPLED